MFDLFDGLGAQSVGAGSARTPRDIYTANVYVEKNKQLLDEIASIEDCARTGNQCPMHSSEGGSLPWTTGWPDTASSLIVQATISGMAIFMDAIRDLKGLALRKAYQASLNAGEVHTLVVLNVGEDGIQELLALYDAARALAKQADFVSEAVKSQYERAVVEATKAGWQEESRPDEKIPKPIALPEMDCPTSWTRTSGVCCPAGWSWDASSKQCVRPASKPSTTNWVVVGGLTLLVAGGIYAVTRAA